MPIEVSNKIEALPEALPVTQALPRSPVANLPYYWLNIFLGAFLLFAVQLILGKYLLPWFGGTPALWTTCMFFFQALLLAGYAYAHALVNWFTVRLLWLAAMALRWQGFLLPGQAWRPYGSDHAFTGDAIPIHLLTKEAFEIYLREIREPDGMIALHITNAHLDLRPVMVKVAEDLRLHYAWLHSDGDGAITTYNDWVLLTRDPSEMNSVATLGEQSTEAQQGRDLPLWTDQYSNVLSVARR
jgi:hypothetical protein